MQKILSRIIFIGFGIQIVLSILWMCNAFASLKGPAEGIVCVGAILALMLSVVLLKRIISEEKSLWSDVFVAMAVVTFPFVMQTVMNPDRRVVVTVLLLLASGGVLHVLPKQKGFRCFLVVLCFSVFGAGIVLGAETIGRDPVNLQVRWTERIAGTTLQDIHEKVPKESRKKVPYSRMSDFAGEISGIEKELYPYLVNKYGEEEALAVLADYRAVAWERWTSRIVKEAAWDGAGYLIAPVVVSMQLSGRGYDSYTGMNYRELLLPAPELGKLYTGYGCWWFVVAFVCGTVLTVLRLIKKEYCLYVPGCVSLGIPALVMVLLYALNGAGRMDYKNTLVILCGWLVWMAVCALPMGGNSDEKE